MLLSDYVIEFLARKGIRDLFLVSGGGIMYLLDSVGRNPDVRYFCSYHEQAAVVEAEGYARVRNGVGACLVTTGPGEANAVSALPAAWAGGAVARDPPRALHDRHHHQRAGL